LDKSALFLDTPGQPGATGLCHTDVTTDPELAEIVDAWASLPAALRAGILAMIRAAKR
jgi:hypothetical protein